MKLLRRGHDRGFADHGWLKSHHTFSFAEYYDPKFMGFGPLRVINDDRLSKGRGFGTHPHRDMEILTYVVDGALEHKDSIGNGSVIFAGEVQRMTAGTGVTHSEFNHSKTDELHFLQIWLLPEATGLTPSYEQKSFNEKREDVLCLVASRGGREDSMSIRQDADIYASLLRPGARLSHTIEPNRMVWLQVISGVVRVSGETLSEGDAIALVAEERMDIEAEWLTHLLLFDVPAGARGTLS